MAKILIFRSKFLSRQNFLGGPKSQFLESSKPGDVFCTSNQYHNSKSRSSDCYRILAKNVVLAARVKIAFLAKIRSQSEEPLFELWY